jgi:hypothetical protein
MIRKNSEAAAVAFETAGNCGKKRLRDVDAITVHITTLNNI